MTDHYSRQLERIDILRRTLKTRRLIIRICSGLSFLIILGILFLALEALFHFNPGIRLVLALFYISSLLIILIWSCLVPVFNIFDKKTPSDEILAGRVGLYVHGIRDRLLNAIQINQENYFHEDGTSGDLAETAIEIIDHQTRGLDYRKAVRDYPLSFILRHFIVLISVGLLAFILFPDSVRQAFNRLANPLNQYNVPGNFTWIIEPGDAQLIEGDSLSILIRTIGSPPKSAYLHIKESIHQPRQNHIVLPFRYEIASVQRSFEYFVNGDGFKSKTYYVEVKNRPLVRNLQIDLKPPDYTGMPKQFLESNTGNILALPGTQVTLSITANKNLKQALICFDHREPLTMKVIGIEGYAEFNVSRFDRYWISLTDSYGIVSIDPISYTILIQPDLSPIARIQLPAKDIDLDENMWIPLTLEAEDDFGFTGTRIVYWITSQTQSSSSETNQKYFSTSSGSRDTRRLNFNFTWDVDSLHLVPQDYITYYFEAWDNDWISGPKSGRSEIYRARFPSLMEIFQDVTQMQDIQIDSLEKMIDYGSEFEEKLNELLEDTKVQREITWEEKRQIREILEKQMSFDDQMNNLDLEITEITEKLEKNDLVSNETIEKYQELQELFQEIVTPELMDAMEKFQEALEKMNEEMLRESAEKLEINQEILMKSLERTIAMLKQLKIEQKLDEMIQRLSNLSSQQNEINQSLIENPDSNLESKENKACQDAESFEKSMQNLSLEMNSHPNMPAEEMQGILDSLLQEPLSQQMEEMSGMLSEKQNQSAMSQGQKIRRSLSGLTAKMQNLKQTLNNSMQSRIQQALKTATLQSLMVSQAQENLMHQMQQGHLSTSEAAQQQAALMNNVGQISDSLYRASLQTLQLPSQIGQSLARAGSGMQTALNLIKQGNNKSGSPQAQAMGALNITAALLQDLQNEMQTGSGGSGMDQFMKDLGSMSEQQMALNRKLADMLGQGQLTLNQQAAYSKLIAEQQSIRQQIKEMLDRYSERSDMAGRIGSIMDSMDKAIEELKSNRLSQDTIDRQEQILSKMLDAQLSIHERDLSRKRRAKTGQDVIRQSPSGQDINQSHWRDLLMRDLLRLGETGYSSDYQELIKQYFEELIKLMEEENAPR